VITLHQFQQGAVTEIERHIAEGRLKLLLVAPTGSAAPAAEHASIC
jgi:hypothetical protein